MVDFNFLVAIVSLVAGVTSIPLAIVAIVFTYKTSQQTKDALAEINTKARIIEAVTASSQQQLLDTVTAIARPKRPNSRAVAYDYVFE